MRVPGYCTGCRKIKQVTAKTMGPGAAIGMCADCQERATRPEIELTVYITTPGTTSEREAIPPAAAIVGRRRGGLIEVAYESRPDLPSNLAAFEERLGRAADRLLSGSPMGRARVDADRLHAVGTFDTRLRRMTAVHDRAALGRWLAAGGRQLITTGAATPGEAPPQTYRIEVRFDVTGTQYEAAVAARRAAALLDGDITAIFDEDWDEIQ
jgi:hypothetical protein